MQWENADVAIGLEQAFCLTYRGLAPDADRAKLVGLFVKLLRLPEAEAEQALHNPPVQLSCDPSRDRVRQHQLGLARIGCITSIDTAWRYEHWSIPDDLQREFEDNARQARVFALLQIRPAPGHSRLHQWGKLLTDVKYHALNHAELLLESSASQNQGAGNWLRKVRQQLLPVLRDWQADVQLDSSFAMRPEDGEHLPDLLDVLQQRLQGQSAESKQTAEMLKDMTMPAWPLAGARWRLVLRLPKSALDSAALDEQQRSWMKAQWPIADMAPSGSDSELRELPGWLNQYVEQAAVREHQSQKILEHFSALDQLPSLPAVAQRVCQLAREEDSSSEELTRTVEQDPSLSTRLLAVVNSSYFGLQARVDSIAHALVLLGREEVAHLALLVSGETVFRGLRNEGGERLWRHSARTAEVARLLARKIDHPNSSAVYTAALLHDVGKIYLLSFFPDLCRDIEEKAKRYELPIYELERETFGHDHASLGAAILRRWALPETICRSVEQHHGARPGDAQLSMDAALVAVADHIAHRLDNDRQFSDATRLRQQQIQTLQPSLGMQDYDTLELLAEDLRGQLRELH